MSLPICTEVSNDWYVETNLKGFKRKYSTDTTAPGVEGPKFCVVNKNPVLDEV